MITQEEYILRRQTLASRLPEDSIAIIPAASDMLRNGDSHFRFRQDSDFYYLTGFNEADALLLITAGKNGKSYLFNLARNPVLEQWNGPRLGQEGARLTLGIDEAFPLEKLEAQLPLLLSDKQAVYFAIGRYPIWATRILNAWNVVKSQSRKGIAAPEAFCDLVPILSEMRLIKSPAEINLMRKAAEITVAAHKRVLRTCQTAQYEYQLEAEIVHECYRQGCQNVAYNSIVAAGSNACVLHYSSNNQVLKSGDLLLVDAGSEFENYASDVTRTFPINGQFTTEQRQIYQLVLDAQQAGINCIKPGNPWDEAQRTIVDIITRGLVKLGLLQGEVTELIAKEAYKPFYMHHSGHWLGLDVHDCGRYKLHNQWRPLMPGMVLTVEPGLYINPGSVGVDRRWWGIGVRIEDDILVTPDGCDNLTRDLPVEVDEIEAFMRG